MMDEEPHAPEDATSAGSGFADEEAPYYHPRSPRQVGVILCVVFMAVGIAVVVVYQQGHEKPVMTRQMLLPPEAAQPSVAAFPPSTGLGTRNCLHGGGACPGGGGGGGGGGGVCPGAGGGMGPGAGGGGGACPAGQGCPGAGGAGTACPGGAGCPGGASARPVAFVAPDLSPQPPTAQPAVCLRCGGQALSLCDRCNAIMLPLSEGLFYCPHCGAVGTPLCPYCSARMTTGTSRLARSPTATPPTASAGASPAGGQFLCPTCNTTGLPNWTAAGVPVCPNCGSPMTRWGARP
jgi:hypothetical protein